MRVELRRLRAGELDHELIWLAVTLGAAAAAIIWLAWQLPWPVCTFHRLTGYPCLTCGATRASLAFLHGNIGAAFRLNPLVFVGLCAVVLFDCYALVVLSTGARRVRVVVTKPSVRRRLLATLAVAAVANWIYLLQQ